VVEAQSSAAHLQARKVKSPLTRRPPQSKQTVEQEEREGREEKAQLFPNFPIFLFNLKSAVEPLIFTDGH